MRPGVGRWRVGEKGIMKTLELPHPLSKFAVSGTINDGISADVLLEFVQDWTLRQEGSAKHRAAGWFLLESARAVFEACSEAGIYAETLSGHLRQCQAGENSLAK